MPHSRLDTAREVQEAAGIADTDGLAEVTMALGESFELRLQTLVAGLEQG